MATDQIDVVPAEFTFVVLAVMNLPASVAVCEYVAEVAPEMIEHWLGSRVVAAETALVHLNHWWLVVGSG